MKRSNIKLHAQVLVHRRDLREQSVGVHDDAAQLSELELVNRRLESLCHLAIGEQSIPTLRCVFQGLLRSFDSDVLIGRQGVPH